VQVIVDLEGFARLRAGIAGTLVATSGGFDPLHVGHLRCLAAARAMGDALVVIVNGDGYLVRKKGYAFMPIEERLEILDALRCVDYVLPYDDGTPVVSAAVMLIRPDVFAKGIELQDPSRLPEYEACLAAGSRIVLGVGGSKIRSSSELVSRAPHGSSGAEHCPPGASRRAQGSPQKAP
jgi:cytidyltransferase-like protein